MRLGHNAEVTGLGRNRSDDFMVVDIMEYHEDGTPHRWARVD